MGRRLADLLALAAATLLVLLLILPGGRAAYALIYTSYPLPVSFVKFALLATGGELLALRIRSGNWRIRGFGAGWKMLVWGLLGMAIHWAFIIFSAGVPAAFPGMAALPGLWGRIAGAFLISLFMNLMFAPVMMLVHNLTDRHLAGNRGRWKPADWNTALLLAETDWNKMWGFVYKRTIPLFWIPAHTLTFLLPGEYRTLFAALLSVALGLLMAFATAAHPNPMEAEGKGGRI